MPSSSAEHGFDLLALRLRISVLLRNVAARDSKSYPESGFAYSPMANLALLIGMTCSAIGALVLLLGTVLFLFHGEWLRCFASFIAFWMQLALYVVFQRVGNGG